MVLFAGGTEMRKSKVSQLWSRGLAVAFLLVVLTAGCGQQQAVRFKGNILADQSITLQAGATLDGRALTRIAAVTLSNLREGGIAHA